MAVIPFPGGTLNLKSSIKSFQHRLYGAAADAQYCGDLWIRQTFHEQFTHSLLTRR